MDKDEGKQGQRGKGIGAEVLKSYRELKVWDKAYALSLSVYRLTRDFPATELYGLVTQMRRAAVSIPSNIAEGCGRGSTQEYIRSLRTAFGSNSELQTQVMLSRDLKYLLPASSGLLVQEICEVELMLKALLNRLAAGRKPAA